MRHAEAQCETPVRKSVFFLSTAMRGVPSSKSAPMVEYGREGGREEGIDANGVGPLLKLSVGSKVGTDGFVPVK